VVTVLRGPADAAHYRVPVGRYNDRWYTDPLPSCPIAEASDWQGPSWSIVKGAAGKDWSYVTNKRNGHTPRHELERIAALEPAERVSAFNAINKHGLEQAGGRGTIVHWWAEDLLAGRAPREVTDPMLFTHRLPKASLVEAFDYLPALHAFFDHYQPEVIAAEYVAIHRDLNGVGYGCTPDVVARIQGQVLGIDWKTRGADSDHGAYPEEAAQIAAGARAQYIIIEGPDGAPRRSQVPHIDAGIVVSIRPDGCRVYPVDLDHGAAHLEAMHAFWVARLTEKAAIGKPWAPAPTAQPAPLDGFTRIAEIVPADMIIDIVPDYTVTSLTLATAMLEWSAELRTYLKDWWPGDTPTPGAVRRGNRTATPRDRTTL
jgi:hypothetical protein